MAEAGAKQDAEHKASSAPVPKIPARFQFRIRFMFPPLR